MLSKHQFLINSKNAKAIGKSGMAEKLDKCMVDFFNAISKEVLNGDDDLFAVQWAISKLDDNEREQIVVSTEDIGCH